MGIFAVFMEYGYLRWLQCPNFKCRSNVKVTNYFFSHTLYTQLILILHANYEGSV